MKDGNAQAMAFLLALIAVPAMAQEKAVTPEGTKKLTAQQDKKLALCRKQAGAKKLMGRERETFIVQCLKGQT
jgi:psiF repeat-containing protein